MRGMRKFVGMLVYLVLCFAYSLYGAVAGLDQAATAAVCLSWASGVAVFVGGNVLVHKHASKNGGN